MSELKPRHSAYGFSCADCNKFVHKGYDARDKVGLPDNNAVCEDCGANYSDKTRRDNP